MLASLVKGLCSYPHSPGRKPYLSRVKRVTPGISLGGVRREVSKLPKRWVAERSFAWLGRDRRHSKDYERRTESSEAWIKISAIGGMTRRLAPDETRKPIPFKYARSEYSTAFRRWLRVADSSPVPSEARLKPSGQRPAQRLSEPSAAEAFRPKAGSTSLRAKRG